MSNLADVFEMLTCRLTNMEMKVDDLSPLARHTQRWVNFFSLHGIKCSRDVPDNLKHTAFTVCSLSHKYTVITVCGTDNTYESLSKYAAKIGDIPKPFILVDTPVFFNDGKRQFWNNTLYQKDHNLVPVIGVLVWDRNGYDSTITSMVSTVQLAEEDGTCCLIWQDDIEWVFSCPTFCFRPHGYDSLPSGKSFRDTFKLWRNSMQIWNDS
jgi:hypothetical protein